MSRLKIIPAAFLAGVCVAAGIASATPRTIDLLPHIDPQQDAVAGQWKMTSEGIVLAQPAEKSPGVLQLPYEPPEEYDFLVEFTPQSSGKEVVQCLYAGGRSFAWKMNAGDAKPPLYCFHVFDQESDPRKSTEVLARKPKAIEQGKRYTSMVEVRRDGLRALLDGEEYVKWSGDFRRFTAPPAFALKADRRLGIGAWARSVVFHRVVVRAISGPGKLKLPPPVIENSIAMKLVSIPAGEFLMGANEEKVARCLKAAKNSMENSRAKGDDNRVKTLEREIEQFNSLLPQHRVVITKPFFLGAYPVTQQEFTKVMGFNPSAFWANSKAVRVRQAVAGQDTSRHPAENMTWEDAAEFCRQMSALPEEVAAGRTYRLPTEAEWEYACRAETTTNFYWGNQTKTEITADYAWVWGNSGHKTHPAGEKRPNPWGLFDMIGNVAEWCADWYDPQTYATSPLRDPTGPSSGVERVMRGRGWWTGEDVGETSCTSWVRSRKLPGRREAFWGFRVACDVSAPAPQAVETAPETTVMKDAETRLKEKGLSRRMGYFLLPDEASFIRYCGTIERLRVACFHAQRECQDAQRQLSRVQSAKAGAVQARMQARSAIGYSDTWREHWAAVRARNQASDAAMLVDLSKEGVQKWQKDAQDDLDSAVALFAGQIDKLHKMYEKLQKDYAKLYEDRTVKHVLAEMNSQGKTTYRIGPTPSASAAVKKLEHEQGLLAQFKKQ